MAENISISYLDESYQNNQSEFRHLFYFTLICEHLHDNGIVNTPEVTSYIWTGDSILTGELPLIEGNELAIVEWDVLKDAIQSANMVFLRGGHELFHNHLNSGQSLAESIISVDEDLRPNLILLSSDSEYALLLPNKSDKKTINNSRFDIHSIPTENISKLISEIDDFLYFFGRPVMEEYPYSIAELPPDETHQSYLATYFAAVRLYINTLKDAINPLIIPEINKNSTFEDLSSFQVNPNSKESETDLEKQAAPIIEKIAENLLIGEYTFLKDAFKDEEPLSSNLDLLENFLKKYDANELASHCSIPFNNSGVLDILSFMMNITYHLAGIVYLYGLGQIYNQPSRVVISVHLLVNCSSILKDLLFPVAVISENLYGERCPILQYKSRDYKIEENGIKNKYGKNDFEKDWKQIIDKDDILNSIFQSWKQKERKTRKLRNRSPLAHGYFLEKSDHNLFDLSESIRLNSQELHGVLMELYSELREKYKDRVELVKQNSEKYEEREKIEDYKIALESFSQVDFPSFFKGLDGVGQLNKQSKWLSEICSEHDLYLITLMPSSSKKVIMT